MRRLMYAMALTAGLCVAGSGMAQPRSGGPDRGRGDAPDVRRLEAQLEQLNAKLNELEARLARLQRAPAPKDEPRGERPGDRPRFAGPGGDRPGFGDGRGPGPGGMGFGRFGPDGPRGPGGVRGERGGPGGSRGPGAGGPPDIGRRLDRIINELEQLKVDLQAQRR